MGRLNPNLEALIESISACTGHRIEFIASPEDRREERQSWEIRSDDGELYGLVEVDAGPQGLNETHSSLYVQLATLIADEINLRKRTLSLENRFRLLDRQNAELAAMNRALSDMAYRDPLSTLYRRWYLSEQCKLEMMRAARYARPFSMLMIDLDYFKRVNDGHGHAAGDAVLKNFASLLQQTCRTSDVLARFGGDEFCALLTDTPPSGAAEVAERIRQRCETSPFPHDDAEFRITCSIGVATYGKEVGDGLVTMESIMDEIDRAMYAAKEEGRNKVKIVPRDPLLLEAEN
jgi:diguanylate cyclase (GGDEF)-like protein